MEKELMETPSIDELSKGIALVLLAEWVAINDGKTRLESNEYMEEAQTLADFLHAIGYRLEKGTPKELMDCLFSEEDLTAVFMDWMEKHPEIEDIIRETSPIKRCRIACEAQLQSPKLKAYITEQVKEVIKALAEYNMGKISVERCAELLGVNSFEFMELY